MTSYVLLSLLQVGTAENILFINPVLIPLPLFFGQVLDI